MLLAQARLQQAIYHGDVVSTTNTSADSISTLAIHLPMFATLAQLRESAAHDLRMMNVGEVRFEKHDRMLYAVSYTHLTLPTNREV